MYVRAHSARILPAGHHLEQTPTQVLPLQNQRPQAVISTHGTRHGRPTQPWHRRQGHQIADRSAKCWQRWGNKCCPKLNIAFHSTNTVNVDTFAWG